MLKEFVTVALMLFCTSQLDAEPVAISLHSHPDESSAVVGRILLQDEFEVLNLGPGWAEVRHKDGQAWMTIEDLWRVIEQRSECVDRDAAANSLDFKKSDPQLAQKEWHSLDGLVDFVTGNHELEKKMSDPFYKHRVTKISTEWGPFYYHKTRFYYVKGISFARFYQEHVRLAFAKRRFSYREIFGGLWSDEFMEIVLKSNRGWLRNRDIFGKGREYFLELSYHF